MRIVTLLNQLHPLKGFVYDKVDYEPGGCGEKPILIKVEVREDKRSLGRCGKCGEPGPCHDHLQRRAYQSVPLAYGYGQKYLTMVYQLDKGCRRLLWIGKKRKEETLARFFDEFGTDFSEKLRYVCSDMWKPYLKVIAERAVNALHILDRFHIMMHMSEAVDEVRRDEMRRLREEKREAVLSKSRWCLLKRPENLTSKQEVRLGELLGMNLRTVRAYLLKESFQQFWEYLRPSWAGRYLDNWYKTAMRSRLEPFKKFVKMMRNHRNLILNWFAANKDLNSGIVEGLNNKAQTRIKMAYGYRKVETLNTALFHQMGGLPMPPEAHRFF